MAIVDVHFPMNQPQACGSGSQTYLLLILIHTNFRSYDRREASRETWAAGKALDESVVILYFISEDMESGEFPGHKYTLQRESDLHHDIVLSNFSHTDQFSRVLVPSAVWIKRFCPYISYVLNVVDHSVVDLNKLVPYLKLKRAHTANRPQLVCDYLMPNESTVLNSFAKSDKGFCSASAFLTAPSVMKELASTLQNNQENVKGVWLSDICRLASVPITTTLKMFTGNRKKPSMLKELMSANYPNSDVMVAVVRSQIPGRETVLMRQAWHLIQAHYSQVDKQGQTPLDSTESGSILMFAVILMLIDFSVIFFIFTLIFCKRRLKLYV